MSKYFMENRELLFLLLLVVLSTVLPHPDNVTPIGALGLFAGCYVRKSGFLLLPVAAAFLADITTIGIYSVLIMFFVYTGHLLSSLCGRYFVRDRSIAMGLPVGVIAASLGFYLVSNIGNWWVYQPHTLAGLIECYTLGLPYLARTLLGNALYASLFFGAYALFGQFIAREGFAERR